MSKPYGRCRNGNACTAKERMRRLPGLAMLSIARHFKNVRLANLWRFRKRITGDMHVRDFDFPLKSTLEKPFDAFQEMVKRRFSDVHMAQSRLKAMTALYLRCAGYTMEAVDEEMQRHSPASTTRTGQLDAAVQRQKVLICLRRARRYCDIASSEVSPEKLQIFVAEAELIEREKTEQAARLVFH